jgi:hypothetical protein
MAPRLVSLPAARFLALAVAPLLMMAAPLFVTFLSADSAQAQPRACQTVQLQSTKGHVNRRSPVSGETESIRVGECVPDGNIIVTDQASVGKLRLAAPNEAGSIAIGPESSVLVGFPIGGHPTKLLLTRGQIRVASSARSVPEAVRLHLLRMTVIPKAKGTVILAQTWRNDEEAWIVVVHGSAEVRLGNQAPGMNLSAGQSAYVTSEQASLPHAVALDSQEMNALSHDGDFEHPIAQLMTIEITPEQLRDQQKADAAKSKALAEEKMDSHFVPNPRGGQSNGQNPNSEMTLDTNMDMDDDHDVMLDSLVAAPKLPTPPAAQPKQRQPHVVASSPNPPAPKGMVPAPITSTVVHAPLAVQSEAVTSNKADDSKIWTARLDFGPVFYSDAAGMDVSAAAIHRVQGGDGLEKISFGGGAGYSGASKSQLDVHNWKAFGLANYRLPLSTSIDMTPELQLGLASESVQDSTTSFVSGAAFYFSARVLFEAVIARSPSLHPGIALGYQDIAGGAGLSSVVLSASLGFDL